MNKREKMSIFVDGRIQIRGGNFYYKKDLDAKVKLLKEEGWTVKFGKYEGINEGGFRHFYEAKKKEKMKKITCPKCGSRNIIPIIYGLQISGEKFEKGEAICGGCEIDENNPDFYCRDCKNKFK